MTTQFTFFMGLPVLVILNNENRRVPHGTLSFSMDMKKIKIVALFLISLLVGLGCSYKKNSLEDHYGFTEFRKLSGNRLNIGNTIKRAYELLLVDNLLIVSDPNERFHFTVIDIEIEKKLGEFGKIGDGPCELTFPSGMQVTGRGDKIVGVNNRNKFSYQEFDLSSFGTDVGGRDVCFNATKGFNYNYQKIILVKDGLFAGTGLFESRFAISKVDEPEPSWYFGEYPFSEDLSEFDHNILAMAFQGEMLMRPSGGKFVSTSIASFNFDIVRIGPDGSFELESEHRFWPPSFSGISGSFIQATMNSENKYGCLSTSVSDDYIYILFSGKKMNANAMYSRTIFVFDWDGNPVEVIELDQDLNLISISQNDEYLIGYVDDGQANLYKFPLK